MGSFFVQGELKLHYEDYPAELEQADQPGVPVLMIAPGGMRSEISMWANAPWNPIEQLRKNFRVIAMDQRNAGQSSGPIEPNHGWHTYAEDQLALLDHLGIDKFHVVGMCIGGPYGFGLIEAAPGRCCSAVLFQPIGLHENRDAFYQMFDSWSQAGVGEQSDATHMARFRENMFAGDFLFNQTREQVAKVNHPILILRGDDLYHPAAISDELAELAANAELITNWKEPADQVGAAAAVLEFLQTHSPSSAA